MQTAPEFGDSGDGAAGAVCILAVVAQTTRKLLIHPSAQRVFVMSPHEW
jgi:hypothetical protein